uniref:Uncharacterized protein n=1 Tax=Planktothricoides sp. SpSt-374 TaxID=2282167 RepID=A0A7C3ZLW7_9CYAN
MPRSSKPQKPNNSDSEIIYTVVGFRSPYREGKLRTIELVGVPGIRQKNGQCVVPEKTQRFFDSLLVGKLFTVSIRLRDCNFNQLKIWLYDTDATMRERGYEVASIDNRDLLIPSPIPSSQLEAIYVLDNELTGPEYQKWERDARQLLTPLFQEFITPPEPPDILANNPVVQFLQSLGENLDPYSQAKRKITFNALIVQID